MDIETSTQQTFREGSVSSRIIEPLQIYDPLLVLLKVKLRLNNWWVITGCGITILLVATILLTNGRKSSIFSTPVQLLVFSAAYVMMVGTYLSLPSAMADLFNRLWENRVIGDGHADTRGSLSYLEFAEKQVRWIGSRWSAAIALLVATLNPLFLVFVHPIWIGIPLWLELIVIILILVGNYAVFLVFAWLLMMAITTHQLFRAFTLRVKPLHSDGSGGLGLFSRFLWITIPFLVMIAGCSIAVFWGSTSSGAVGRILFLADIVAYLLLASLPLRAWLALPHQAMVQARNKLLQPLTDEYERALGETMSGDLGDTTVVNEGTERLTALQKRYEQVRNSFPTWPIEIMQLRGLVTLLILPVLLALLPLLLDLFTKK